MVTTLAMTKPKPERVIYGDCQGDCWRVDSRGETYGVRGHGHGKDVDDLTPPVRLEHIAGEKTVVDGCGVV